MCGIVGYIGKNPAVPILVEGLRKLEYRGYDSAGIAIIDKKHKDGLLVTKNVGKIDDLSSKIENSDIKNSDSTIGIAHTRWATHGEPTLTNAHPHVDCKGEIAVVHNGIIENYRSLRELLEKEGHKFKTDTDTEVLAHLFEKYYAEGKNLLEAVRQGLLLVTGTYGIAVISKTNPNILIGAKQGSPLIIGKTQKEAFIASDVSAILRHTNEVVHMEDKDMVLLQKLDSGIIEYDLYALDKTKVDRKTEKINLSLDMIEKKGYAHYMQKEIFEQPTALRNAIRGRLDLANGTARLDGLSKYEKMLPSIERIIMIGCGTSWHAGLIGEYLIEEFASIPTETEYASEFRYRSPVINKNTVAFTISQSGETADTKAALEEAQRKGATVLGICNVVGSSIARKTDAGVFIHAGAEIGVASTKAFTSQVMVLNLISLMLGRMRYLSLAEGQRIVKEIEELPTKIEYTLEKTHKITHNLAKKYKDAKNFLYLGRKYNFPVALEGALKLKEISYVHAEGYPAAAMKHGPIALIDENMPVLFLATDDSMYDKVINNIKEVKSRKGKIIVVATEGNEKIKEDVEDVIYVPYVSEYLSPIVNIIPLQLFAYYMAVENGRDVDQPRNLAKSVTVE